ncbi:TonB-dependent receptor [Acidicapsa ligni]|uniref:TonB-dependent receptor n=1 Tax=Acidicapsa ligni TaxID=542300 RepID=UPI0021DF5B98|nr:TonB-dependent receptor [Acidicapsa ligni]
MKLTIRNLSISFLAGLLFILGSTLARAQFEDGSLVGTIHDPSGAAIPGAMVSATNNATGIVAKAAANATGDYEFPSLRVGVYTVRAEAQGFSAAVAQEINISVAGRTRINLELKIGGTENTVEVTGVSLALETETSERGQNISNYQTEALPLVSRQYSDLLGLVTGSRQAPTAATTTAATSLVRAGSYNVNGQRSMFNNFLLDGMDNNAYGESNQGFDNQIIAPPPDSIAQFEVVTNNESAQYGRSSGATINVASASGTNKFHTTLYEFIRNTDLNAAGFFKPTVGTTPFQKPVFNRNQFGFNLGGPILKDKLFFFLDYEGFRQTLKPLVVLTMPTQAELKGVLAVDVQDPLAPGTVYKAGTSLLTSPDISPLSRQLLGYFSGLQNLPLSGAAGSGLASNDYPSEAPFTDNSDKGSLRLDYQENASSSWFLHISDRKETGINYPTIPLPLDGQTNGRTLIHDEQVAAGYTHLFGSNKVLDARLGLSGTRGGKFSLSIGDDAFNIPGLPTDPTVAGGLPSTSITGGYTAFGRQSTNPQWQYPSLLDPKINYSWVRGHHSFKFGYEFEHVWMEVQDSNPLYGSFSYGGGFSACPLLADGSTDPNCANPKAAADTYWADFLFGTTNNYALATYFLAHLLQTMHSTYAQDDWHATSKLTLNLGLRWEYGSPYSEVHNHLSNFDPTATSTATALLLAKSGSTYDRTLVNPDYADWAPRLGFAYAVTPKFAVRGGYGISYIHYTRAGSGDILAINAPFALFVSVPQKPNTAGYRTVDQGFPQGLASNFNPATDNITYIPRDTRDSRVQSYFLSGQYELAKNTILDIAYVGNIGGRLQGFLNANQINPAKGFTRPYANIWPSDITEALNGFKSNYNSLQARYEQRFVAGLTLLNSFTWSHALDNASASLEGNTPSPQDGNNIQADYSQSDYNLPIANVTSLVYDLPVGHGRRFMASSNRVTEAVLGGWQISAINTMQAGTPFNLGYTPNSANAVSPQITATYRGANEYRPNVVPGVKPFEKTTLSSGYIQYVNYAAYTLPGTKDASGALLSPFGNASRNPGRTPAYYTTDLDFNKRFNTPIDGMKVEFRGELYNVFNHTNLYLPSSGLGGVPGSAPTSGGTITSTFEPRIVQFGLKVIY